jgi:hypothetical protein
MAVRRLEQSGTMMRDKYRLTLKRNKKTNGSGVPNDVGCAKIEILFTGRMIMMALMNSRRPIFSFWFLKLFGSAFMLYVQVHCAQSGSKDHVNFV